IRSAAAEAGATVGGAPADRFASAIRMATLPVWRGPQAFWRAFPFFHQRGSLFAAEAGGMLGEHGVPRDAGLLGDRVRTDCLRHSLQETYSRLGRQTPSRGRGAHR